ncbi:hypothetical protein BO94DRAFT_538145 [Aspergillus sclerotioniger CBS 115572]|uniref:Extracellular membrane protein CFEM domain-containing protein n=1 Tax=Aspergillus sclerotioniger CBS 115572 TaxID=1450535 RepID=A0A317VWJ4_9EURO|nr:hypothetical protein BO94DRAFT_538145 [Aspergillus sclerotioniger CBS 115572]PWY77278.1 hypothetical protein BO94DRAFT_538145 [Aspergillus sclerotioniger CBS 115572]
MKVSAIVTILATTALSVMAAPAADQSANGLMARGDSGCYAFADPDCGVDGTFCQCANGWFYLFNTDEGGCNPPWGIVAKDISGLPGYYC